MFCKVITHDQIELPLFEQGKRIPHVLHQTYKTNALPKELAHSVEHLKELNPGWQYKFYDDAAVVSYILQNYGKKIYSYYLRINPKYGAARADLFRYLLMYKEGGVYLDIKSTIKKPLDEIIRQEDRYLLCSWCNMKGQPYEGFGMHKELKDIEDGEYQQWHIIAAPGAPFLREVICKVLKNIDNYRPWRCGVGKDAVLRLTGPIAYTLAIHPLRTKYQHRYERFSNDCGLIYTTLQDENQHKTVLKNHYSKQVESIIQLQGWRKLLGVFYTWRKKLSRKIRED
ncbi:MAG: glycosyltransferase family 32 protein [Acidaminococcaceae bacterium]